MTQKRVAALHDISCVGRCSLTVALPILSIAGIETSVIPTAVLSTHTGGFKGYTFRDLTEDILPIVEHWQSLQLHFDSIYTGYLGSLEQIEIVSESFKRLKAKDTLIFIDPVMADHGALYSNFSDDFPQAMKKLCQHAQMIIPNMTEAVFLLGESYKKPPYSKTYIERLLKDLAKLGPSVVFLTGVAFNHNELGAAYYDARTGEINYIFSERIEGVYHGTGDIFGSALLAGIIKNHPLQQALSIAIEFVLQSIKRTKNAATDPRYGVNFEQGLVAFGKQVCLDESQ